MPAPPCDRIERLGRATMISLDLVSPLKSAGALCSQSVHLPFGRFMICSCQQIEQSVGNSIVRSGPSTARPSRSPQTQYRQSSTPGRSSLVSFATTLSIFEQRRRAIKLQSAVISDCAQVFQLNKFGSGSAIERRPGCDEFAPSRIYRQPSPSTFRTALQLSESRPP